MIPKGLDNQLLHIEFYQLPSGEVKVIEINGRMDLGMITVHAELLEKYDYFQILLKLATGEKVQVPSLRDGLHGLAGILDTFLSGKAGDTLDYAEMSKIPEISAWYAADEYISVGDGMFGAIVAETTLTGSSPEGWYSSMRLHTGTLDYLGQYVNDYVMLLIVLIRIFQSDWQAKNFIVDSTLKERTLFSFI